MKRWRPSLRTVRSTVLKRYHPNARVVGGSPLRSVETVEFIEGRKAAQLIHYEVQAFDFIEGQLGADSFALLEDALAFHSELVEEWKVPGWEPEDEPLDD